MKELVQYKNAISKRGEEKHCPSHVGSATLEVSGNYFRTRRNLETVCNGGYPSCGRGYQFHDLIM